MKTIAITIEEDILERVDRLARAGRRSGKNRSRIIREAVRKYVALVEQTAEEEREAAIVHRHRDRLQRESQALIKQQAKE